MKIHKFGSEKWNDGFKEGQERKDKEWRDKIEKAIDECDFVRGCKKGKGCAEELKKSLLGTSSEDKA